MANTMIKLQTVTVGASGAASIDFTSIPQTFTDLKLVFSLRSAVVDASADIKLTINTVVTNRTWRDLVGSGSTVASYNSTTGHSGTMVGSTATASVFGNGEIYIPNYTSSNNKSFSFDTVGENNATAAITRLGAGLWSSTAAITSLSLSDLGGSNLTQYSTATLYGIKSS